ncbi:MAG: UDP-3-O-(3-hydroxymyristoyl)glucosamine N-acyltransferase [Ignavibacteria bacterium]|nr:UDP-3-O-(3-hydroxymyristoyl)glucosamine N-acyltransferase [Ignavibacteria bacterium]
MKKNNFKTVGEIAALIDGIPIGDAAISIIGVNRLEYALEGEITFLSNPKFKKYISNSQAGCIIIPHDFVIENDIQSTAFIRHENPYAAFVKLLRVFVPEKSYPQGYIHPNVVIGDSSVIAATAYIGAGCIVSDRCEIADDVVLVGNVILYDDVSIGQNSIIHANAVCYNGTIIGKRTIIHAGAVLGADGFGFHEAEDGKFEKIPQVGTVIIGDECEIGANTTIDRAFVGATILENGVKVDNLVHIAHNVTIGENTAIAAQAGVSGSTKIGARNRIAGQVGVVGHIETVPDVIVHAQSGVAKSILTEGHYFGSPAKPHGEELKILVALKHLPQILRDVTELKAIQKKE